jgi:hypothetical protein
MDRLCGREAGNTSRDKGFWRYHYRVIGKSLPSKEAVAAVSDRRIFEPPISAVGDRRYSCGGFYN